MKYIALAVVAFAAGAELGLAKDQASARRHALTEHPKRKGWYLLSGPVQLKAGEEFHFDGDLPKGMAQAVEPQQKAKAAKPKGDAVDALLSTLAIANAEKAVADAQAALDAAADADAAAAAQATLDQATAALAALQA